MDNETLDVTLEQISHWDQEQILYIDTRGSISYGHGHIEHAVLLKNIYDLRKSIPYEESKKYIIYCTYGETSRQIVPELRNMGYEAYNLKGGYRAWLLNKASDEEKDELVRYDRQIILSEIGIDGQMKLKHAKVLIIGAGGLGAPAALYLAGAGVGQIGLIDADTVGLSNLQRQIIFNETMTGQNKAKAAKEVLQKLNSGIRIKTYQEFLTVQNAEEILSEYDFIIDAVDNFETKFLINDTCVLLKKPFCHAGILRFQGQVMTYVPEISPCYRCIFQEIPEQGAMPNCSQVGVIGAMAGIIGSIQALEAVKFFTGAGELLTGRMFVLDGLTMNSRIVKLPARNPSCRACGSKADKKRIADDPSAYQIRTCSIK